MTPLHGITVLDLTRVLSGPYCTMMLADMGARVIKVEQPGKGDDTRAWGPPFRQGESAYFLSINRNKESVTLDFKEPEGRAVLDRLIAARRRDRRELQARDAREARPGLRVARRTHPRLVYCSISGFGQTGPRRKEPGYDAVMQAEGGLMSITGSADGPPFRLGVAIADIVSGMFAAQGITAALFARERTGRGQAVDIAMLDSVVGAADLSGGHLFRDRRRAAASGQPPSDHRALRDVPGLGRRLRHRGRQRRAVAAVLRRGRHRADERFATNRHRVTRLRRAQARPRRAARDRHARTGSSG